MNNEGVPDAVMAGSAEAWSAAAKGYKQFGSMRSAAGLQATGLQAGEAVLDVGTGPGDLAIFAAQEMGALVTAVDFSPGMIQLLHQRLAEMPVPVTAHVMDGQNLELEDSIFDVVHSSFGVTLFPDFRMGLKEMVRVAKPGGRVVVVGGKAGCSTYAPWTRLLNGGTFPDAQPVPQPVARKFMGTSEGMVKELTEAGLEHVEVSEERCEFRITDVGATVQGSLRNPFMQAVEKKLTAERWVELQEALCESLAALQLDDGANGYYIQNLIACGRKPLE